MKCYKIKTQISILKKWFCDVISLDFWGWIIININFVRFKCFIIVFECIISLAYLLYLFSWALLFCVPRILPTTVLNCILTQTQNLSANLSRPWFWCTVPPPPYIAIHECYNFYIIIQRSALIISLNLYFSLCTFSLTLKSTLLSNSIIKHRVKKFLFSFLSTLPGKTVQGGNYSYNKSLCHFLYFL